jgi:hypothetical protein
VKAYLLFDEGFWPMFIGKSRWEDIKKHANEIDVPEEATGIQYGFNTVARDKLLSCGSIDIPRPKKKVKKWRCEGRLDGFKITTELITFDEAQMLSRYVDGLYRMEDTMIEVEE